MWVIIGVCGDGGGPPPGTTTCLDSLSVVSPGQSFRPSVTVRVGSGQLLQSRGDLLRNKDGNVFSAWPHIAVVGTVNTGASYTFVFYVDHPMIAPQAQGSYDSVWQLWQNGAWSGDTCTIHFTVRNG